MRTYPARIVKDGNVILKDYPAENYAEAMIAALEEYGHFPGVKIQVPMLYHYVISRDGQERLCSELELSQHIWMIPVKPPLFAQTWLEARDAFGIPLTPYQQSMLARQREALA